MLGHKLCQILDDEFEVWTTIRPAFNEVSGFGIFHEARTISNIDVESISDIESAIFLVRPDVVINAAGIIKQLPSSKDVITTLSINSILPHRLRELSLKYGFRLVCVSTDCVFSGERGNYSEDDRADAYDLYGRSKNFGEVIADNCLTIRTSIIGREIKSAHSMVEWFLSNRGNKVNGYANAIYSGFPTIVFADIIAELLTQHSSLHGLYHISSEPINKFDLLQLINKYYEAKIEIERFEDFSIDRSLDSTRFREAVKFTPMPWEKMIERMASDPTPYERWRK